MQHPGPHHHDRSRRTIILLPVLNEIDNIAELMSRIRQEMAARDHVVCVVDDGSRDGTREWLETRATDPNSRVHLIKRTKTTRGSQRGSALFAAMLWGIHQDFELFVEMDGDLSHRPEELPDGLSLLESGAADVAIASKYAHGGMTINRPIGRRFVSRVCNYAVRALITPRIKDYSNGYRFYTHRAAVSVASKRIRYASPIYLTEALAIWLSDNMRVVEFKSLYIGRNEGLSKLRIVDLIKASGAIFEVATRYHLRGFAATDQENMGGVTHLESGV
jgi:dolichol-phosphate mannosyltransferase